MADPVDLTNLRSMTDGDKDLEKELFREFFIASAANLQTLGAHCADGADETWRATAHAFKGAAYNLGAGALGELCRQAQECAAASGAEKRTLLEKIRSEYAAVEQYLQSVHAS